MRKNAAEALVFQDEVEIHLFPPLARTWKKGGPPAAGAGPGEKRQAGGSYGGVDYITGKITQTIAATKSGVNFLAFLIFLAKVYAGRKVRLICDNGRFHCTRAVQQWLAAHRSQIEIYWLPPYCPSLNLIERLWGHLKRTVLANVLFRNLDDLADAFRRGIGRVNGHREQMGFMFDHDDVLEKKAA